MSSERDVERVVRTWLRDGLDSLPDRYLDAALDEISTTNQRRRGPSAWRPSEMNTFARFGLAAAAVLIVAIVGWTMLSSGAPRVAGPGPTAPPTPTASPTPVVSPSGTPIPVVHESTSTFGAKFSVPFSYDVPTTWTRTAVSTANFNIIDETVATGFGYYGISAYSLVHLYKDPCKWKSGFLNPGPESQMTPDQVATEMKKWPGFTMGAPTPVTVDGYSGVRVDFHSNVADTTSCDTSAQARLMEADAGDFDEFYAAQVQTRWILLEVKGHLVLLEVWSSNTPLADRLPALQRVLDSIKFS